MVFVNASFTHRRTYNNSISEQGSPVYVLFYTFRSTTIVLTGAEP